MYSNPHSDRNPEAQLPRTRTRKATERWVALRLDFVAKPEGSGDLANSIATRLETARLEEVGLVSSLLLVCDREARLVTLVTFWHAHQFLPARERRIVWIEKLIAPFADGTVRAHTGIASFFAAAPGTDLPAGLLGSLPFGAASLLAVG